MFWVPQPATPIVVPAGAGVVSFDSMGQATFQQPLQVIGVLPTFAAGVSGFAGLAKGVAGVVLGSGAAMNGSNSNGRSRRGRRQPHGRGEPKEASQASLEGRDAEDWYDCQEYDPADGNSDLVTSAKYSPVYTQGGEYVSSNANDAKVLMVQLEDEEQQKHAIANIRGSVLDLALDSEGCHVIQQALSVVNQKEAAELASELRGHIRIAIESKYGNYVVQKIVEVLPISVASFVVEELRGIAGEMARHRYGCRILCRLFEHSGTEARTAELINDLLSDVKELSRHAYGYHVVRCILEHGLTEHRTHVAMSLCNGAPRHAKHRHASFVIEKALVHCDEKARDVLAYELLQRKEVIVDLARHQFGRHVASQLVRSPGSCSEKALLNLREGLPQVQTSKHGRRLIEELKQQLLINAAG